MNASGRVSLQGFVGTLPVVLVDKAIEALLLLFKGSRWWSDNGLFEGTMHALVTRVVTRFPGARARSGRIPRRIHQADRTLNPPSAREAKGAPLSLRMTWGNPYSLNTHSNQGLTLAVSG